MTKQKTKIVSKYPLKRRTTFKSHPKHYAKVYAPYLPAVIGLIAGASILLSGSSQPSKSVLSYGTSTPDSLLSATNERRSENNIPALQSDSELSKAAQLKADDMVSKNYWSHVTPDGKQPWYFIQKSGYSYSAAAENLAYGFTSSKDTINGWMNSPEHKAAMLGKAFSEVGFGITNSPDYQGHGPETVVVALYASPAAPNLAKVNSSFSERQASGISRGQLLTEGNSPWINFILGAAIGIIAMYLATTHSLKLRKKIKRGENYIMAHPVLDVTLMALLVLMIALSTTVGFTL